MRKHRFYYIGALTANQNVNLDQDTSHYIARVLRLQPNDEIFLFNNTGAEFSALITNINKNTVTATVTNMFSATHESPCKINLGQVIGKGEKMELVIQKATELGVHSITPLYSEYSNIKYAPDRVAAKVEHWQRIANAACCQCWRNIIPTVHPPQDISNWITQNIDQTKLLFSTNPNAVKINSLKLPTPISLLIGPEGGFSDAEIQDALTNNFTAVSLGPRILRTETAGIAAIAILQALHGDM